MLRTEPPGRGGKSSGSPKLMAGGLASESCFGLSVSFTDGVDDILGFLLFILIQRNSRHVWLYLEF